MSLDVEALHFTYDGAPLLRGLSFKVNRGDSVFLLGPSGEGKTTVLRCIAGLERPGSGTISLDGTDLAEVPTHQRGIGMLMQEPALFPHLNAWQNVAFGMRYSGVPRADEEAQAERLLDLVGLQEKRDAMPDELSGGQRQRVALARALAAKPQAVLLDEPLSGLHGAMREELGQSIRNLLREQNVAALWVTHDEAEATRLGDRVLRLEGGSLQPQGNAP